MKPESLGASITIASRDTVESQFAQRKPMAGCHTGGLSRVGGQPRIHFRECFLESCQKSPKDIEQGQGIGFKMYRVRSFLSNELILALFISVSFFIVGILVVGRHELWFDESQAWLMAKASSSLFELFEHLKGERHPILWYLCLFAITRVTHDPFAMQLFHLLIASANVFLIAHFSPFKIWIKLPLICSYFFAFEYCVISRNYALGVFFVLLFCTISSREKKSLWAQIFILCLLSNTNAYGLIIAIAFAATMVFERVCAGEKPFAKHLSRRNFIPVLALLLVFSLAIYQLTRVKHWHGSYKDWIRYDGVRSDKRLVATVDTIWRSYVPLPKFSVFSFWNTNLMLEEVPTKNAFTLVGVLIFLFWAILFRQRPAALFFYLTASGGILCFTFAENIGYLRHCGHLFITLIASCWLYTSRPVTADAKQGVLFEMSRTLAPLFEPAMCLLLAPHVVAGLYADYMDYRYTFNGLKDVSTFILTHNLARLPLAGHVDTRVSPLAAYLDKPVYYLTFQEYGTFVDWKTRTKGKLSNEQVIEKLRDFVESQSQPCLIVLTEPIMRPIPGIDHRLVFAVCGAIRINDDKYFVYIIKPVDAPWKDRGNAKS